MSREIIIKVGKPESKTEIQDFKRFRLDLKALLKQGKMKGVEKFRNYTFTISECSSHEEQSVAVFLKETTTVELML